jgi:DNA repair protein RadC
MKEYKSNLPQIELKYKTTGETKKVKIGSSNDCMELSKVLFNTDTIEINEEVIVLFLNRNNSTIGWIRHTSGGMASSIIDVRLILVTALNCLAHAVILLHNHPSGNVQPSDSDIQIAQKLKRACESLDIQLLDSVIVNPEFKHYSLADNGKI